MIEPYGQAPDGQAVHRITLQGGITVRVLTYGGIIQSLEAPDRLGHRASVVLGLEHVSDYATRSPHLGAMTGRFAGRIAGARFRLDGIEYRLARNNGENALHGGPAGFDKVVWSIDSSSDRHVTLRYVSPDGEEGYPGELTTTVTYTANSGTLRVEYHAETTSPTVLNLTNHSYFNLSGEGEEDVMGHVLQIPSGRFLTLRADSIPTGGIGTVDGTPLDFRNPQPIGARIRVAHEQIMFARGYDQFYLIEGSGLRPAARVGEPATGRRMEVWTDQPGVQLYTANKLAGDLVGLSGRAYRAGDGLCLETQHYPDSPNHPHFPSTVLRPGESFRSVTEYRFSVVSTGEGISGSMGAGTGEPT